MNTSTSLAAVLALSAPLAGANPLFQAPGPVSEETAGWRFVPSQPDEKGRTFDEFEGLYPDKGGQLRSPSIPLGKEPGKGAYYRLRFRARVPDRGYQAVDFYNAAGTRLPDLYDTLYAPGGDAGRGAAGPCDAEGFRAYDRVFYAMDIVASVELVFSQPRSVEVRDVVLEDATPEDAAAYCDRVYTSMPPVSFTPPADATQLLPRTMAALREGRPWRIVLLGDSIMQDAFHSQFHALVRREFPAATNIEWVISMRGGTGMMFYQMADSFETYLGDKAPDLLVIGGISHPRTEPASEWVSSYGVVARAAAARFGCEILVLSDALCIDTRHWDVDDPKRNLPAQPFNLGMVDGPEGNWRTVMADLCRQHGWAYWEMTEPCYRWLYGTGLPHEFYSRDYVHSGEIGKQCIGRVLLAYLTGQTPTWRF